MSETSETSQQRQARIRQQKREAKLKSQGQERLDKITQLSGRTPETMRDQALAAAPQVSQSQTPIPEQLDDPPVSVPTSIFGQSSNPEQARLREEYMRVLLGGSQQGQNADAQQPGVPDENDPMMKMMQQILGGMNGDANAQSPGGLPFSPDDVSKMTGLPSFLTSMFMGGTPQAPPAPEQISRERTWKILRTVAAVLIGVYTVFTLDHAITTFGYSPPAPATMQNPFIVFLMSELLVYGSRIALSRTPAGQTGLKSYFRASKDVAADGAILVFMAGLYSWWKGLL